jgi:putative tryptophan/tyrosine transport system substrate-binding protein
MRRREFISGIVGSAAAWPLTARAQQPDLMRRIGVVIVNGPNEALGHDHIAALRKRLAELGWVEGRNITIEYRFSGGNAELVRAHAAELVALSPDLILVQGTPGATAFHRATQTIPIVFTTVADPVTAGLVESMSRPGGNVTGFSAFELDIGGKWLQLLKELNPELRHVGGIVDPAFTAFAKLWKTMGDTAPSMGLETTTIAFHDRSDDIESAVASFAASSPGGLISLPTAINNVERRRISAISERYRLPLIYPFTHYLSDGGLMSYGLNIVQSFVWGADYVNRILRGAKPADLPVQAPVRYDLAINLRTARELGITVPPMLLARADELIE